MIRFSISQKLMCAFLGLTLIVLIATLGLARWSFERGFLDYVNALEQVRLENVSEQVADLYIENNKQWRGIDERELRFNLNQAPPDPRGEGFARRPPPPPEGRPDRRGPPPKRRGQRPRFPPTALYDLQGDRIAGQVLTGLTPDAINVPVVVDGENVAVLKSEPIRAVSSSIETAFSRQQWVGSVIIGIASLLLAALVAWLFTRLLVSPVRNIIHVVNRMSKGNYSHSLTNTYNDEFGLLVDDINHLTKTLEKNRSARSRWLADISHELRTPLAVLTGEVEAMKDGIRPFGPEQLASLDQEIQRLRFLVDDLYELSLSDIGGLRYEFTETDLVESINQAIATHQLSASDKKIVIDFDDRPSVMMSADHQRINQLLANLIRNSLAYTDPEGRIEFVLNKLDGQAVLEIHDTPPGVSPENCSHLFEPLYREDESRSRRGSGAGLGLAICRNIVEAHRGTISASPSPLGGLRVTITLPLMHKGDIA